MHVSTIMVQVSMKHKSMIGDFLVMNGQKNGRTTIMIIILIITIAMIGMILGEINIRQSIKRQFHETAYLSIYQLLHSIVPIIFIVNIIKTLVNW